ncbi:MAG: hypothetical protein Q4D41_04840 [Prevotellaceae bacterium]|nr:hypothetical protein [Prevotellaceae bacterium]
MKPISILKTFIAVATFSIAAIGCSNDEDEGYMIFDFYPFEINIIVKDASGNDLINPQTPNNISENGIKVLYNGNVYEKDSLKNEVPPMSTRAIMPRLYGLKTEKDTNGAYRLCFGEFNGEGSYDGETFVIDWNDGTKDTISFDSHISWKSKNDPVITRAVYLNGEKTGYPITIIK